MTMRTPPGLKLEPEGIELPVSWTSIYWKNLWPIERRRCLIFGLVLSKHGSGQIMISAWLCFMSSMNCIKDDSCRLGGFSFKQGVAHWRVGCKFAEINLQLFLIVVNGVLVLMEDLMPVLE